MQPDEQDIEPAESHAGAAQELPTIAIVGRPNVGKSALFNRIVRRRIAIVAEESGVTRDRVIAPARCQDKRFLLIDTGGLGLYRKEKADDIFDDLIRDQLEVALEDAAQVIMVVDVQAGLTPLDEEVAAVLRARGKAVIVAANKADNDSLASQAGEFERLGFTRVVPISCLHNRNLAELTQHATADFPRTPEGAKSEVLEIAIIGRPNVGKSSIVNRLLGEERVMVTEVPGTTRDAVDVPFTFAAGERTIKANLIDTAGVRRRRKIDNAVEYFSVQRTEAAIKRADAVIMVLDGTDPATAQDKRICRLVQDSGKACLILANKWDLASQTFKQAELLQWIGDALPGMEYALRLTCCAVSGYNFADVLTCLAQLDEQLRLEFPTSLVNRVLHDAALRVPPPLTGGRTFKFYYATFRHNRPPTFVLFVNDRRRCRENYARYLRNQLSQALDLSGVPVVLEMRNRPRGDSRGGARASIDARAKAKAGRPSKKGKQRRRRRKS